MDLTQTKALFKDLINTWHRSYYIWFFLFCTMSVLSIGLPLLIASGLVGEKANQILGFATAFCVGVLTWSNIGVAATKFENAKNVLQQALIDYPEDQQKLSSALKNAREVLSNSNPTALPQSSAQLVAK